MDDRDRKAMLSYATPQRSRPPRRAFASKGAWNAAVASFILNAPITLATVTSGHHGENYGQFLALVFAAIVTVVIETYGFLQAVGKSRPGAVAIVSDLLVAMGVPLVTFAATVYATMIL